MSSPALLASTMFMIFFSLAGLRSTIGRFMEGGSNRSTLYAAPAPAVMQQATAYLTVPGSAANAVWPNNGDIPVVAFGWGKDRPLAVIVRADSLNPVIFRSPETPPLLTIQKRSDIFSPMFQQIYATTETIPTASFSVNRVRGGTITYTLHDVRVLSYRSVGQIADENPVTEEGVLTFSSVEIDTR